MEVRQVALINLTLEQLVFADKPTIHNFTDLTGQKFSRLTVLGYAGKADGKIATWYCRCICGTIKTVRRNDLTSGKTISCGCYQRENATRKATKHGKRFTDEYKIYQLIKNRCTNPNDSRYKRYGGRGIELKLTFDEFVNEIGLRPSKEYSVDRINNDGNYDLGNIQWATKFEQANNRSNNFNITYKGETLSLANWARKLDLGYHTLKKRLYKGYCVNHAFNPIKGKQPPKNCPDCSLI